MEIKQYHTKTGKRIRLIHGDCMQWMKDCEENEYQLCISDPPYGIEKQISVGGGSHTKSQVKFHQLYSENHKKWDAAPEDQFFVLLKEKSLNQIIWGGNYFTLGYTRGFIVWDKKQMMPNFSRCEFAWTSFDCPSVIIELPYFGNAKTDIGEKIHPTQKPVKLYRYLINKYAKCQNCDGYGYLYENSYECVTKDKTVECKKCNGRGKDRIIDTHGGSMSHAIACWEEDFELDIIELDRDYYDAALKRFEQHISQKTLF